MMATDTAELDQALAGGDEAGQASKPEGEVAPVSMDDTIRETLRSIAERKGPEETPAADKPEATEKPARERDEQGKFKAKAGETPVDTPAASAEKPEGEATAQPPKPPNGWRPEVAAKWASLPEDVRAEFERREADFHKGIEAYKSAAQFAQTMERAIAPYTATIQSLNITPDRAVSELLAADHRLRYSQPAEKAAYFAQLAKSYGIDLAQLGQHANQGQGDQTPLPPQLTEVQQRIQQLEQFIQHQQNVARSQADASLNSEITRFAADPSHSHFEAVRGHMAALLQAGQAKDLQDAYEQAIYANPVTRPAVLEQQAQAAREEAAKKASAAKQAASVNVRTRPALPSSEPIGTMDETIRAELRRLLGG